MNVTVATQATESGISARSTKVIKEPPSPFAHTLEQILLMQNFMFKGHRCRTSEDFTTTTNSYNPSIVYQVGNHLGKTGPIFYHWHFFVQYILLQAMNLFHRQVIETLFA